MDDLPVVLTGVCQKVDRVMVSRVQDAAARRVPFQQKFGAGLTLEAFGRKKAEGTLCHAGLRESLDMIAHHLGWKLDRTTESLAPVVTEKDVSSGGTQRPARGRSGVR